MTHTFSSGPTKPEPHPTPPTIPPTGTPHPTPRPSPQPEPPNPLSPPGTTQAPIEPRK